MEIIVDTNNGVRKQNKDLKDNSLSGIIQKLSGYLTSMNLDDYSFELHQERVDK